MNRFWILLILFAFVFSSASAQLPIDDELYISVLGVEGSTRFERGEYIKGQLRKMSVGYVVAPFNKVTIQNLDTITISGENIIARIGKGTGNIIVGAHYDIFDDSPGANDNGSGVAVALALINHLQNVEWNFTVDFCFFDQEEVEFAGSFSYVKQFIIPQKHLAMINLDVEGTGKEVFVGPVGDHNRSIIRYVHEAAQRTGFPFVERTEFPGSDHIPFIESDLECITISIIPKGEADELIKFLHNGYKPDSTNTSKILRVMHTENDRSNLISPASLKMSYEFTKTLLLLLNEAQLNSVMENK